MRIPRVHPAAASHGRFAYAVVEVDGATALRAKPDCETTRSGAIHNPVRPHLASTRPRACSPIIVLMPANRRSTEPAALQLLPSRVIVRVRICIVHPIRTSGQRVASTGRIHNRYQSARQAIHCFFATKRLSPHASAAMRRSNLVVRAPIPGRFLRRCAPHYDTRVAASHPPHPPCPKYRRSVTMSPAVTRNPSLLRRHSTSSSVTAHSLRTIQSTSRSVSVAPK